MNLRELEEEKLKARTTHFFRFQEPMWKTLAFV